METTASKFACRYNRGFKERAAAVERVAVDQMALRGGAFVVVVADQGGAGQLNGASGSTFLSNGVTPRRGEKG